MRLRYRFRPLGCRDSKNVIHLGSFLPMTTPFGSLSVAAVHANVARVVAALNDQGVHADVREFAESTRTAADAAAVLGCSVGAIANSLVFMSDRTPVLVLTSGAHRVDTGHLAQQLGARKVARASAQDVREATGQPIGGVAPVGHSPPLRTYIDIDLARFPTIWASAGTPRSVFGTTYQELLSITDAEPVSVTPPPD
jgi:prolyl-tRNA editing enzyme YbaK/EbsC (Cys-tRNA(Pro) deacylase)